ncbi:exodeoxyribonuclease VII small subunit [Candidatus Rubidus massiliensis]|nr:MAG: exodeoxyribonuclease VII small subunit [Chlamydia sp. 32-24]CDZ80600.1 exodeoxyribonuclease VII small subunit [Candidatus Rubidus massiliensis]
MTQNYDLNSLSFEKGFLRLEEILEKMNSETIELEESLKLYEEADQLIQLCNKKLNDAEKKIEVLIKGRNGEIIMSADRQPLTQDFQDNSPPTS